MKTEEIIKHLNTGVFHAKVHEYCDGYCEYCPHTKKCINFFMQNKAFGREGCKKENCNKFWTEVVNESESLELFLHKFADIIGFDFEILPQRNYRKRALRAIQHNQDSVANVLENTESFKQNMKKSLKQKIKGSFKKGRKITDEQLREYMEIIEWLSYQYFYKVVRAFDCHEEGKTSEANKNARTALEMIKRLMNVLGIYSHHFKNSQNNIVPVIVELHWIHTIINDKFPEAANTVREGID